MKALFIFRHFFYIYRFALTFMSSLSIALMKYTESARQNNGTNFGHLCKIFQMRSFGDLPCCRSILSLRSTYRYKCDVVLCSSMFSVYVNMFYAVRKKRRPTNRNCRSQRCAVLRKKQTSFKLLAKVFRFGCCRTFSCLTCFMPRCFVSYFSLFLLVFAVGINLNKFAYLITPCFGFFVGSSRSTY